MKLSEAMLLGSTVKELDPDCWSGCLLGLSCAAFGAENLFNKEAEARWPWITQEVDSPSIFRDLYPSLSEKRLPFTHTISDLAHRVKLGEITIDYAIDYVRSVEPQEQQTETKTIESRETVLAEAL